MRLTIERVRTLILAAGVLLVVALAVFLTVAKFKSPFNRRDIPKRLGIDIQQEANGVTYTQAHGGNAIFKIHASKVIQLKNDHAMLHDVQIELYGANGSRVDQIAGNEFEYDQKSGVATAAGPVEITLMRPAAPAAETGKPGAKRNPAKGRAAKELEAERAASAAAPGQGNAIHVKTSGLVFDQQTGLASTSQRVEFTSIDGSGSSMGAAYNDNIGDLILDSNVELDTRRGASAVKIQAQHAEFDRDAQLCHLRGATAQTRDEQATAARADLQFRDDGSIELLNASGGMTLANDSGSRVAAPNGWLAFDEDNRPRRGALSGGVVMDSASGGRTVHGTAPAMALEFTAQGDLRHMHLERGVEVHSLERSQEAANGQAVPAVTSRTWRSPVADIDFRQPSPGQIEPATIDGIDGVVISGETRRGDAAPERSRLEADEVAGVFGPDSTLSAMTGTGHASLEQITATGARESATSDRLDVRFVEARFATAPAPAAKASTRTTAANTRGSSKAAVVSGQVSQPGAGQPGAIAAGQVQSAVLEGHVTLVNQPVQRAGAAPQPPLRATAGHAVYESAGQWLHLTMNPRIDNGGLDLSADKVDVTQQTGDAFAHGNVKATWLGDNASAPGQFASSGAAALGGKGPAHAIAAEAQLHQATGEATFRGHARLWQLDNSVSAPLVVIDRQKQTLVARTADAAEPVRAVLLSQSTPVNQSTRVNPSTSANLPGGARSSTGSAQSGRASAVPSVVRVRGGELWYSGVDRKAIVRAGVLGSVTAESDGAQSSSDEVDLYLSPAGAPRPASHTAAAAPAQVERMVAAGHVVLTSQSRRGTGQQLVYTSQTGNYVLTGSASAPPRMTDPEQGSVTGEALIFHSRDDSVSIEGGAHETVTETTAPR